MRALVKMSYEPWDFELRRVERPTAGPSEVLLKIDAAGICGTDLKIALGHYTAYQPPVIIGHEFCGTVVEVGAGANPALSGALATARSTMSTCGVCRYCREGLENLCDRRSRLGFDCAGAFAEFAKVPVAKVHVLPPSVGIRAGALIEPSAVVIHGLRDQVFGPSSYVFIVGCGPIALLALLLSRSRGATVAISGLARDRHRLGLAGRLGAAETLIADEIDAIAAVKRATDGYGADIVIECTGSPVGVQTALTTCRKRGTILQLGTNSDELRVDYMRVAYKELNVRGSFSHTATDWEDAVKFADTNRTALESLIDATLPLSSWREAFGYIESGTRVKVVFNPSASA